MCCTLQNREDKRTRYPVSLESGLQRLVVVTVPAAPTPLLQDVGGVQKGRHCLRFKQKKGHALQQLNTSRHPDTAVLPLSYGAVGNPIQLV